MTSKQSKSDAKGGGGGSSQQPPSQTQTPKEGIELVNLKESILLALQKQGEYLEEKIKVSQHEIKASQLEIRQEIKEVKEVVQENYDKATKNLMSVMSGLSEAVVQTEKKVKALKMDVEVKMKEVDQKVFRVEDRAQRLENEVTMIQFRSMELAVRLRGISENSREDLRKVCSDALSVMLKISPEEICNNMDKVYRVNSRVARQRQLPRDVVIYFTDRKMRNDIMDKSFVSTVQIEGKEIGIFKELPPKMLRDRKDFGFLTSELRKQQIPFRWDAPVGIILRYQGERYRLNTVAKAEDFYYRVLKERPASPRTSTVLEIKESDDKQIVQKTDEQAKQMREEIAQWEAAESRCLPLGGPMIDLPVEITGPPKTTRDVALDLARMSEAKDQRVTRAVYKQILEKQQQGNAKPMCEKKEAKMDVLEGGAVGGAEPKTFDVDESLRMMFLTLRGVPDDH